MSQLLFAGGLARGAAQGPWAPRTAAGWAVAVGDSRTRALRCP